MSEAFLTQIARTNDFDEVQLRYRRYYEYLAQVQHRMPPGAYDFACASWHYDPKDHRCPHDSWIRKLSIEELNTGLATAARMVMKLTALGAYHDGIIEIEYLDVVSYKLVAGGTEPGFGTWHGDWVVDEVRMWKGGEYVEHEIVFSNDARWCVVCGDIRYAWKPL